MKIALDLSPTEDNPAGIGIFAQNLFGELVKQDKKNSYVAYSRGGVKMEGVENKLVPLARFGPLKGMRWISDISLDAKRTEVDLLISPSNHIFTHFFPRTLQFVHDLAPIKYPRFFSKKAAFMYNLTTNIALAKAHKVLTISKQVKQELEEKSPDDNPKIEVIYPGLNQWVLKGNSKDKTILEKYSLEAKKYMICIYTLEPRKNHINLIKGFAKFKKESGSDIKLALAGKKGWYYDEIFETVSEFGLEDEVKFLGYVPNEDVASLYGYAKASIMLSFYEGFGIPLIESLYFDLPTLAADIPVFREVLAENALYTDPFDPDIISDSLKSLIKEKKPNTKDYILKNFTYERSAKELLRVIEESRS